MIRNHVITRRQILKTGLAAPAAFWLAAAPARAEQAGTLSPKMDGDFRGGCCVFEGIQDGALVCRPAAPPTASGNLWYWFTGRLTGGRGPQKIELHWPTTTEASAQSEYGGNKNFATVLDRAINVSRDLARWTPVEGVKVEGQVARFTVDAGDGAAPLYVAVGLPYFAQDLENLVAECRKSAEVKITQIAITATGWPVFALRIGPEGHGEGAFYLQAQQHATEWAGSRILGSMVRHLLSDAGRELKERFVWHIVPVMNVGSLYGKGPAGNMNRDWESFKYAETIGARDYIKKLIENGDRLLHAMDLHMGWSSRTNSGGCLTAARPGAASPEIIARQEAFAKHAFAQCDFTKENIWQPEHKNGISFAVWAARELGIPAQTAEFSRHMIWERLKNDWARVRQEHEERLGVQFAEALGSFKWGAS